MLVLDNGDAIRGIAEVASKLDFIVNGYIGTTATQLANGQLANEEGDLYASGADATVVTSIIVVNTDSAARTFTLYLKPSGGTSRAITPISLDLPIGYSFYTDGQRAVILSTSGEVVSAYSAHASSHENGGADEISVAALSGLLADDQHVLDAEVKLIKLDDLTAPDDNTDLDASAAKHGLFPKLDHDKLDGIDASAVDAAGAVSAVEATGLTFAENKGIILDAVLSVDEKWSGITETGIAGAELTVGHLVYLASTGKWLLAKADSATTSSGKLGLCILYASGDTQVTNVLLYGKMRSALFPDSLTKGAPVHISETDAGLIQVAAPTGTTDWVVRIIGYGVTAEDLFFCPDNTYVELA